MSEGICYLRPSLLENKVIRHLSFVNKDSDDNIGTMI